MGVELLELYGAPMSSLEDFVRRLDDGIAALEYLAESGGRIASSSVRIAAVLERFVDELELVSREEPPAS
jgi:hypothetical protein